jgi:AcrR family transcriptional regulator
VVESIAGGKLRGGRHGLPRDVVRDNQRRRILAGVVDAVGGLGYERMTVEAVIARAQVSRRTFYEHFRNKEEAFLAAYDHVLDGIMRRIAEACEAAQNGPGRFGAGLRAFMEALADDPHAARMCIVEVNAAGRNAMARRDAVLRTFAGLLTPEFEPRTRLPDLAAELTVNGLYGVVHARVEAGRAADLPALVPELVPDLLLDLPLDNACSAHRPS